MLGEISETTFKWLDERLSLSAVASAAGKKKVPLHKQSFWYYMGGIAMLLLAVQFLTGILLMVYYIPELSSANSSVLFINSQIDFGWFVRSMHSWGANILIFVLFAHMFSAYFMKAYRKPRELTWISGLGLLMLCFGFGFTGYLLPWDEVAFFATKIGIDIAEQVPLIGGILANLLKGGSEVGQGTLSRFFLLHVIVLPLGLFAIAGIHLLLVQLHGMSEPKSFQEQASEKKKYEMFFPDFFMKDLMVWLLAFNVLATIVILFPWGVGPEADPFAAAPAGIKPEWYFLGMFQFLKLLPAHIGFIEGEKVGLLIFALIGGIFAAAPFIDKGENPKLSMFFDIYGLMILIGLIAFTIWGYLA
jgi:cytochrome b6